MPGTITDDIRASSKVLAEGIVVREYGRCKSLGELAATDGRCGVGAPRFLEVRRNHFSNRIHRAVPRFIALLAVAVSIGLANVADAEYVNFDSTYFTETKCWRTLRVFNSDAITNEYEENDNQQPVAGLYDNWYGNWYAHFNTGDNIGDWWHHYLDEGRYYYLDRVQYKLLGGAAYRGGRFYHYRPFGRMSARAAGFTKGRSGIWIGPYRLYEFLDRGIRLSNHNGYPSRNVYIWNGGPLPISNHVVWNCCFSTGDNIDVWKYYYLDEWRYQYLSGTRYKLLGGRAYMSGYPRWQDWYNYSLMYYPEERFQASMQCCTESAVPEPATVGFFGLGGLGLLILRGKRGAGGTCAV